MNIFLLYNQFYSSNGQVRKIGGIETYIESLAMLFFENKISAYVCQYADTYFEKNLSYANVLGFKVTSMQGLYNCVEPLVDKSQDIIIFMSDVICLKLDDVRCISVQHGIFWDIPFIQGSYFFNGLKRLKAITKSIRNFNKCKYSVCVDYNFYNWYKTFQISKSPRKKMWIVPNFSTQSLNSFSDKDRNDGHINIIFARRFQIFRGSLLFANAIKRILCKYNQVYVTIAGEGPCGNQMMDILKDFSDRVTFTKYLPHESFNIHKNHDIAVVPTTGSEGTSLSLLEAMGAGCVVVSTPVGGLSNILLDEYNGLIAMPEESSLYEKIEKAINLKSEEKIFLCNNAINTVKTSFSLLKWKSAWLEVINEIKKNNF